jgi:hypothetical protein
MMVEVFKTNVQHAGEASRLVALLLRYFPETSINFDLEDCDKVLRLEGSTLRPAAVAQLVQARGFVCTPLE